jgi:hypothetical protein
MGERTLTSRQKLVGGAVLGVVASLAVTALGSAATADATCLSISGINLGHGCTSTMGSFAVGLGPNTTASATGLLSIAIADGRTNTGAQTTDSDSEGNLAIALAVGADSHARSIGTLDIAAAVGNGTTGFAGLQPQDFANLAIDLTPNNTPAQLSEALAAAIVNGQAGFGNVALNRFGPGSALESQGALNLTINLGGTTSHVRAAGVGNVATTVKGTGNHVSAIAGSGLTTPGLSLAFNLFGRNNTVTAGDTGGNPALGGPGAIAGAIFVRNHTGATAITQQNSGINIKTPLGPLSVSAPAPASAASGPVAGKPVTVKHATGTTNKKAKLTMRGSQPEGH